MEGVTTQWLQSVLWGEPLGPGEEAQFADETAAANQGRLRVMLIVMMLLHIAHVVAFRTPAADRAAVAPQLLVFWDALLVTHGTTALVVALLAAGAWFLDRRHTWWLTPLAGLTYLLHGAVIAGVDQLNIPTVSPFMAYAFMIAVVLVMPPLHGFAIYGLGVVAYFTALGVMQPDPEIRLTLFPRGPTASAASAVMLWYFWHSRRRDFRLRRTVEQQRSDLEQLNNQLEHRVADQVEEIVARAAEVDRLNAQLRVQVQERSRELSLALERLGEKASTEQPSLLGRVLGDRYELQKVVGRGGMGEVFSGLDRKTGSQVAVKLILGQHLGRVEALQRFLQEADAVSRLGHPAVVRMLHVDATDDGYLYQVQELADGLPLNTVLKRHDRLAAPLVARFCGVLADALGAAHNERMVHRDVKPSNIVLTGTYPGLKLLDFGIAKVLAEVVDQGEGRPTGPTTRTGLVVGSPGFMAPEQRMGAPDVAAPADIYALAVVGFNALTGKLPGFDPEDDPEMLDAASEEPLRALLRKCLSIRPTDRPDASEVSRRMHALADAQGAPTLQALVRDQLQAEPSKGS